MHAEDTTIPFRAAFSSAVSYLEPRRLVYNGALILVVAGAFIAGLPDSTRVIGTEWMLLLFILAVLANVAYCAAYVPDVLLQLSAFRNTWLRFRWAQLAVGTLFGACLAYLLVAGPFGLVQGNW